MMSRTLRTFALTLAVAFLASALAQTTLTFWSWRTEDVAAYEQFIAAFHAENPYVGLHRFDEEDASRFFGREQLVAELVDKMERRRMVVAVGPSGSGKSSVVRAGLLPEIRRGAIDGSVASGRGPNACPKRFPIWWQGWGWALRVTC